MLYTLFPWIGDHDFLKLLYESHQSYSQTTYHNNVHIVVTMLYYLQDHSSQVPAKRHGVIRTPGNGRSDNTLRSRASSRRFLQKIKYRCG